MTVITSPYAGLASRSLLRRPRATVWPYAGLLSGAAAFASVPLLSQGPAQFSSSRTPDTGFVLKNLHDATTIKIGGGLAVISVVAGVLFLVGLGRFVERLVPARATLHAAMKLSAAAFTATASLGVILRYVIAGGASGGIDRNIYTREAVATLSALADQVACAAALPVLMTMAMVGWVAVRDRVLPRAVGVAVLGLTALSTGMTLALGLPYSSYLVYPLFALLVGVSALFSPTVSAP